MMTPYAPVNQPICNIDEAEMLVTWFLSNTNITVMEVQLSVVNAWIMAVHLC